MAKKGIYLVPAYDSVETMAYFRKLTNEPYKIDELKREFESEWGKWVFEIREAGVMVGGSDAYFDVDMARGDLAKETIRGYFQAGLTPKKY